jgi:hypothetical protein
VAKKQLSPLHVSIRQRKNKTKLSLHKDQWKQPPPIFTHKAENKGKDIEKEPQQIQQKYSETTQAAKPRASYRNQQAHL